MEPKDYFYYEGCESLAQIAQKSSRCPLPYNCSVRFDRGLSNLV